MENQTAVSVADQIRECNDAFEKAFASHNSDELANLYTPNAILLPPGAGEQKGTKAISQFWQGAMQMGLDNAKLTTVEVEDHGDTAIELGQFDLRSATGEQIDHGKYIVVWKNMNNHWYLDKDIFNSSKAAG